MSQRHYIAIEPVSVRNSEFGTFGNKSDMFWPHADFSTAFVGGFPVDWKLHEDVSARHPDDYRRQYLKVHCHDQTVDGECAKCRAHGWQQTTHRLFYKREHFKRCVCVRLGVLRGEWHWIITWRCHRKGGYK